MSNRNKVLATLVGCLSLFINVPASFGQTSAEVDVCVYGGTSAGVIAAYTARTLGKTVVLIEPGKHLGGLSSGGLGYTDIGNKFAVTGITKSTALELGGFGIRVNSIHPGVIATPMVRAAPEATQRRLDVLMARQPIPRAGTAEEIAKLALFLASDDSSYCTGAEFVIDGGHLAGPYRDPIA